MIPPISLQQKEQIKSMRTQGISCPDIAQKLKITVRVVHKWSAICKNGLSLQPQKGRPKNGSASTFDKEIVDKATAFKNNFSKWGANTIRAELIHKEGFSPQQVPSKSTLKRLFKEKALVQKYQKNTSLSPDNNLPKATKPHQIWQIDDQGAQLFKGVGHVGMINIKCPSSKTYIQPYPVYLAHLRDHLDTQDYQNALRLSFTTFGLPEKIQMDHGSLFYENGSKSPYPTRLHLWLLGLGIDCFWSRVHRPTDQASVERSHRTIFEQVDTSDGFSDRDHFEKVIKERHYALNHYLPSPTEAPFSDISALHSSRFYNYDKESDLFDTDRIYAYLSDKVWYRKVGSNQTVSLGGYTYYSKLLVHGESVKIIMKGKRMVVLGQKASTYFELKGLNTTDFIADNSSNVFVGQQLKLPFD